MNGLNLEFADFIRKFMVRTENLQISLENIWFKLGFCRFHLKIYGLNMEFADFIRKFMV